MCLLPFVLTSCASHTFQLPTGPGAPAPDAAAAWAQATEACRGARTFSAELRLSGRVGATSLRGTLHGAVTSNDQIYLEMPASFGDPYFVLAGTGERAVLVRRDKRTLTAHADEIIEALVGVKLGPRQLLAVLAGCADQTTSFSEARQYPDVTAITTPRARVFLKQTQGRWQVIAAEIAPLLFEYRASGGWPSEVRISSLSSASAAIKLAVGLTQIDVNTQIADSVFVPHPPANAVPMTLEQLRQSGPLGDRQ